MRSRRWLRATADLRGTSRPDVGTNRSDVEAHEENREFERLRVESAILLPIGDASPMGIYIVER